MTQSQLAHVCGDDVSQQTISKIERGLLLPRDSLKLMLADKLDCPPALLFAWPTADRPGDSDRALTTGGRR